MFITGQTYVPVSKSKQGKRTIFKMGVCYWKQFTVNCICSQNKKEDNLWDTSTKMILRKKLNRYAVPSLLLSELIDSGVLLYECSHKDIADCTREANKLWKILQKIKQPTASTVGQDNSKCQMPFH